MRIMYEQLVLPFTVHKLGADLLHFPAWVAPRMIRVPYVVTVHDVIPLLLPMFCRNGTVRHFKNMLPRSVAGAAAIIVPSEQVKRELLSVFSDVEQDSVSVVPFAPVHAPFQGSRDAARRRLSEKYGISDPFLLCVGNIEPRKNLGHLLKAFFAARMKEKFSHRLVIVGRKAWRADLVNRLVESHGMSDMVTIAGYVPEADMGAFYTSASAFCFPSIAEGFGIPLLEALAAGCPCLVSDIPVFHELAGDQATFLPMADLLPWRVAIEQVASAKPDPSAERSRKVRAAQFNWRNTARGVMSVYDRVEKELGLQ
jgi:glycosyltransferase involved in cell wall biosynthesis